MEKNFDQPLKYDQRAYDNIGEKKTRKAFADGSSANIKFSETQLLKMMQLGRFRGRLLGPLLKTGFILMVSVLKPLAKIVLVPLG